VTCKINKIPCRPVHGDVSRCPFQTYNLLELAEGDLIGPEMQPTSNNFITAALAAVRQRLCLLQLQTSVISIPVAILVILIRANFLIGC
jgi:hypothetical protein